MLPLLTASPPPITLSNCHPLTPVTVITTSLRHPVISLPLSPCASPPNAFYFIILLLLLHQIYYLPPPNYFFFSTKISFPFPSLQYFLSSLFSLSIKFLLLLYQISFSFPFQISSPSLPNFLFFSIKFLQPLHQFFVHQFFPLALGLVTN